MKKKYENKIKKYTLTTGGLEAILLESGNIYQINKQIVRINSLSGNNLEPTALNLYAHTRIGDKEVFERLIGIGSNSNFYVKENQAVYYGNIDEIAYKVIFTVLEDTYFFTVKLDLPQGVEAQVIYGMDLAISDLYAVRNNESYVCQYINHSVSKDAMGYTILSRQNQGIPHFMEQGSLTKNVAYSTDGYQFFELAYKLDNQIHSKETGIKNENYQYEFAYSVLESEKLVGSSEVVFYGSYLDELQPVQDKPYLREKVAKLYKNVSIPAFEEGTKLDIKVSFDNVYPYQPLTKEKLDELYPNRKLEEFLDSKPISFFLENGSYVTIGEKEAIQERPTGHILLSTDGQDYEETLASTTWIFGVFSSQVVCGNTSFNKYSNNVRNALNIAKTSGMRMFIKLNGVYKLLSTPAVYEVGFNYAKWIYKIDNELVVVETTISQKNPELVTTVHASKEFEFIVSEFICMAPNEYENPYEVEIEGNKLTFIPDKHSMAGSTYPKLQFTKSFDCDVKIGMDEIFYEDGVSRGDSIYTFSLKAKDFSTVTTGNTFGKNYDFGSETVEEMKENYKKFINRMLGNMHVSFQGEEKETIESYNILLRWYTHNMLVHLTSPHGLEQYSGAAWGARDVCQGPAEYLLATNQFDSLKEIILHVFKQQYLDNGNWPQWFMIDRYYRIQQHDSHGDIIVWPIRLVALYLERSGDYSILDETISYTTKPECTYTEEKYTLREHLENAVKNISLKYIPNTHLSSYGGGDWDDTLQPANHALASNMVSGWTVALTYEAYTKMAEVLKGVDDKTSATYLQLANEIKEDYEKYILVDNIPAGFIYFDGNNIKPIIHPKDTETGMKYRLLPLNRGIVSEIMEEDTKNLSLQIINENLLCPDGVRLMDKTVPYHGGINSYFMRAETAANFGREIGLQYCHAHIRYCEGLAKLGKADEMYHALGVINPIEMNKYVSNALPRQRNAYFSSSDGNFLNRYDAMENYEKLKAGKIGVKGGWRIYSSGPGIYVHQFICSFLGIRMQGKNLLLDPNIPNTLSGLNVDMTIFDKNLHFTFVRDGLKEVKVNSKKVVSTITHLKYREGGLLINFENLNSEDKIEIHF